MDVLVMHCTDSGDMFVFDMSEMNSGVDFRQVHVDGLIIQLS